MAEKNVKNSILVVDDSELRRQVIKNTFKGSFKVIEAENGKEGLELLQKHLYNTAVIILDLYMPIMGGMAFLREWRNRPGMRDVPVIVTTAENAASVEQICLELGAADFVAAPFDIQALRYRVRNVIEKAWAKEEDFDLLTGLFSKDKFRKETERMLKSDTTNTYVYVTVDLDHYTTYNAFYGVTESDALLQYMGKVISDFMVPLMPNCQYGRYEADRFDMCFLFDEEKVQKLVRTVVAALSDYRKEYMIKPSFGAYVVEDKASDVRLMHDKAKLAAQPCKGRYKQYIGFYTERMSEAMVEEQHILNDMDKALENKDFVVYYQPKYELESGKPMGAEALVRWLHPERGMISPDVFIPLFEQNGFVTKLDYYVWENVCEFLKESVEQKGEENVLPISVNISRANLHNPRFVDIMCRLVERFSLSPRLLQLEFTESAIFEDGEILKDTMEKLHAKGFVILMDDFGSGYSSLNMLKDLPIDILKIDRGFLPQDPSSGKGGKIVASVIRMAKWLGISAIAEGAENASQVSFLKEVGCHSVQGFYFARPMPKEDYVKIIARGGVQKTIPAYEDNPQIITEMWKNDRKLNHIFD